ncbi:DegT/DnrJ/EryC1/StrS aminotransferase family protein [Geobacter sp. DSM 9736]|uniref:DegT/DnrJ/EryC1/StrS family aminotransferase n=1 Tax=Geobacter sp. DSM 9736 TaxID=1277350 RepID=UPI000B50D8E7|nr:DegT/DnrJ/EryC1/StrS family aminotransferase [Geobacter sp. DSM 9736]SNB47012.1 dTDP-4-amino-4,6-dideoxygalactose transaminase [Geobacter sp. DSM 9736]
MTFRIPFSGRAHYYSDEEIAVVINAMQTADPLTQGHFRTNFESSFSSYIGVDHSFAVCNATAALEMAAQLCQFEDGDEVIIPSHTFTSSAYPFAKWGAKIVWADIDLQTRVVTASTIAERLSEHTKALVVPHLYGYCADMPAIMDLAENKGLIVIEDAAQSLGTEVDGHKSGSFGDLGIFSFHSHKNITTLGEGGMLTVKNKSFAEIIPMLRHNGHCGFGFDREDYWLPAMGNLDFPLINGAPLWPSNYCLGEVECALGTKLLERLDAINEQKRRRAIAFIDRMSDFPELRFHRVDSPRHNYHLLTAMLTNGKRDEFIRKMAAEKQIQCVVQYYPLNRYPLYDRLGFSKADCPNADFFFDNMVSFPFHHWLSDTDATYMIDATSEILRALRK